MNKLFIITLILVLPVVALAQDYVPLVGIPGVNDSGDFGQYINSLYGLSISIAALLAVIKIIIAGVKWMMTDVAPNKSDAKKDIQGALLGLLVILAAVLILTVINPDLGGANLGFENVNGVTAQTAGDGGGGDGNLTNLEILCQDGLGCEIRECNAMDEYVMASVASGALGGAVGGIYAGSFFGPASLFVIPVFIAVGATVGGVSGYVVNESLTDAECSVVCAWLYGEINAGGACVFPTDSGAFRAAELQQTRDRLALEYNCTNGRLILLGDGSHNCIENIDAAESAEILTNFNVTLDDNQTSQIITMMESSQISDQLVRDDSVTNAIQNELGAQNVIVAFALPDDQTSLEYSQVDSICDITGVGGLVAVDVDGVSYLACAN